MEFQLHNTRTIYSFLYFQCKEMVANQKMVLCNLSCFWNDKQHSNFCRFLTVLQKAIADCFYSLIKMLCLCLVQFSIWSMIHSRLIHGCLFGWTITIHVSQFEPCVYSPISEQLQILVSNRTSSNLWWSCSYAKPPIALFSLKTSHTDSLKYKKMLKLNDHLRVIVPIKYGTYTITRTSRKWQKRKTVSLLVVFW